MNARINLSAIVAEIALLAVLAMSSFLLPVTAAAQAGADEPIIYLNQAWSQNDRASYYHFSQGAVVVSYDIFLKLEVAGGQELFRSDANSERYGLITEPPVRPTTLMACRSASARR